MDNFFIYQMAQFLCGIKDSDDGPGEPSQICLTERLLDFQSRVSSSQLHCRSGLPTLRKNCRSIGVCHVSKNWQQYIDIVRSMVKPALGCTEPIAAAYASSVLANMLEGLGELDCLELEISDNLYKNSMGVFVPGTGKIGVPIAAACGFIGGDSEAELNVLAQLTPDHVAKAQSLIDENKVSVKRATADQPIYCKAKAIVGQNQATVIISGNHSQIVHKELNGDVLISLNTEDASKPGASSLVNDANLSVQKIYEFAENVPYEEIEFILEARNLNIALSDEGMTNKYGLQVGRSMQANIESGLYGNSLSDKIVMLTSAASDARMGGATLPAMSNYGSGNQGIAATIPVCITADHVSASDERLARALILSHLGAIYIKSYYPSLSAFCGNTATSAAAAMAIVYLMGGSKEQSYHAIMNVLSDTSGMVCDGAKATCAMKVGSSSSAAVKAVMVAMKGNAPQRQGIIGVDVEDAIKNVGQMVSCGMSSTNDVIIDIMSDGR
ncbi:L-cysteine desulfidase family protein [Cohaesibacter celericrescens]|uniref:L-cysteine desulfidase family protein n=1 Tax=Cohaesibacter celericrescens TaxID=2067669 RepID=UPI0035655D09